MKKKPIKIMVILAIVLIHLTATIALAAPAPLIKQRSSSAVTILEESSARIISYTSNYFVDSQITKVESNIVLVNTSSDSNAEFFMGIPAYLDQNTLKVNDIEVLIDGKKQSLAKRRNQTSLEDTDISDLPDHWMTWYMSIKPNEHKVITVSYTVDTPSDENGTENIFIPLEYLKAWANPIENVEINVFINGAAPYVFEPNATLMPDSYDGHNQLTWVYNNDEIPSSIKLYYRPIDNIVANYLIEQNPNNKDITSIANAFLNKSYDTVITSINSYLESLDEVIVDETSDNEATLKNELIYVNALSYQNLYQYDKAMELFEQIEDKPMFGELEGTLKNKLIYDKYNYIKSKGETDTTLFDYLDSSKNFVMNNTIFLNWLDNELSELTPPPTPTPAPTEKIEEPVDPDKNEDTKNSKELVTHITIGGVDIAVEYIFLGIIMLIILLFLIFRRKKRRYTSRYLFK